MGIEETLKQPAITFAHGVRDRPPGHQGGRGPQRRPTKLAVTMRYNFEVIAYFKAAREGWQTRMNDALREAGSGRQAV